MFTEDDLLPISALQHLMFCERQWGLIHLEGVWEENRLTAEGRVMHERVHEVDSESRGEVRIARGLRLRCLRLGLTGQADVVEFRRAVAGGQWPVAGGTGGKGEGGPKIDYEYDYEHEHEKTGEGGGEGEVVSDQWPVAGGTAIRIPGARGLWSVFPIEYKRGKPKLDPCDEVQLCAQALCLEEMLGVRIAEGALFYGKTRRRYGVVFDAGLRARTEALTARLHGLQAAGVTPRARYEKKCDNCSLINVCLPKCTGGARSAARYLERGAGEVAGGSWLVDGGDGGEREA